MSASCAPQRRTIRRMSASTPTSSKEGQSAAATKLRSSELVRTPELTSSFSERGLRSGWQPTADALLTMEAEALVGGVGSSRFPPRFPGLMRLFDLSAGL